MHRKDFHNVSQGCHILLSLLFGSFLHLCPSRHHLNEAHFEHRISPLITFAKVISSIILSPCPTGGMSDISGISISTNTYLVLIGTRRSKSVILLTANLHDSDVIDHLRKLRTHSFSVLFKVGICGSMFVCIQVFKVISTTCCKT